MKGRIPGGVHKMTAEELNDLPTPPTPEPRKEGKLMSEYKHHCEICGSPLMKLDHVIPDVFIDLNDDGEKQPVCRNCAVGIIFRSNQTNTEEL